MNKLNNGNCPAGVAIAYAITHSNPKQERSLKRDLVSLLRRGNYASLCIASSLLYKVRGTGR